MNDFSSMMHLLALFVIVYGVWVGVENWIDRVKSIFTSETTFTQHSFGKACDILWIVGAVILVKHGYVTMVWGMI